MTAHDHASEEADPEDAIHQRIQAARDGLDEKLNELERRIQALRPGAWLNDPWVRFAAAVAVGAGVAIGRKNPAVRQILRFAIVATLRHFIADALHRRPATESTNEVPAS